jgi:hypothetical protein
MNLGLFGEKQGNNRRKYGTKDTDSCNYPVSDLGLLFHKNGRMVRIDDELLGMWEKGVTDKGATNFKKLGTDEIWGMLQCGSECFVCPSAIYKT